MNCQTIFFSDLQAETTTPAPACKGNAAFFKSQLLVIITMILFINLMD